MSSNYSSSYYKGSFHKTLAELPKTVIPPPKNRMRCRMGAFRLTDLLKILIGLVFGYSLRMFSETWEEKPVCQVCSECPPNNELEIIRTDDQQQLREPFKPRNRFEVLRFEYFNSSVIYANFDDGPKRGILGHHKSDIKDIIAQTMAIYNMGKPQTGTMKRIINGYRRLDPLRGEEYFLDLEISSRSGQYSDSKLDVMSETRRFQIVKPFSIAQMISNTVIDNNRMIHFILPITYDVDHRLSIFLTTLEEVCVRTRENIYLMVVLFTGKTEAQKLEGEKVKEKFQLLGRRYPGSHIRVIQTGKPFSRAMGLDLGAKQLPPESLLFFTDIDIVWNHEFLSRCRHNAVLGQQVYYPIVFAQYNPQMVLRYSPKEEIRNGLKEINKHTGHWVYYGFGMTCMYNQDYRSAGGFNLEREGWGGEDVELHNKHVVSNLSVFRATDPGLIHIYHNKTCSTGLSGDQMRMCIGSMANGYASKAQLGINLLMPQVQLRSAPSRI